MNEEADDVKKLHDKILNNIIAERLLLNELANHYTISKNEKTEKTNDKFPEALITSVYHNEDISHLMGSGAWGAVITLSSILIALFTMFAMDVNIKPFINKWQPTAFIFLTMFTCTMLIWNFKAIKKMFIIENQGLMKIGITEINYEKHQRAQNSKQEWVRRRENAAYVALALQLFYLLYISIRVWCK